MHKKTRIKSIWMAVMAFLIQSCAVPAIVQKTENKTMRAKYENTTDTTAADTTNSAQIKWKDFFTDSKLIALIDMALLNNQEFNMIQQEIAIAQNEVLARKGAYLPFVNVGGGASMERVGRYTSQGASDAADDIVPGKKVPENLSNFAVGLSMSWEIDIWRKLRNAKDAAIQRYLASVEGRNFMKTQLVAEIAASYYELMALDNILQILQQNIEIQENALDIVKQQKQAARVTELAVRRFEAEVLKNKSRLYYIQQDITETQNHINFLVGRAPQQVDRNSEGFAALVPDTIYQGIPSQLLVNRPDIRQAELELTACKIDVKVAKAEFYPSLRISASVGMQAFNPRFFISPASIIFSFLGEFVGPIINRKAIKAEYFTANSKQTIAVFNYEQTILKAFTEVTNQLAKVDNLQKSYDQKALQVAALIESITISTNLFRSAKADYMEVLLTQRDALEARLELTETKMHQMHTWVDLYRSLGGGWN